MGSKKTVKIGGLLIGGNNSVRVESMLKVPLTDVETCIEEINKVAKCGCELFRVAFPDATLKPYMKRLVDASPIPLMADIHFDFRLALCALDVGVPSIRINPGNIENRNGLRSVIAAAKDNGAAIRIGANSGSINNRQLREALGDRGLALANAVHEQVILLEEENFDNMIVSAKSTSVKETMRVNSILAHRYDYPIHVGITEAGSGIAGVVKGAVGIGSILASGIGDTIRVSLTEPSANEVTVGYEILKALEIRKHGYNLISCPTCGRKRIDVMSLAARIRSIIPEGACDGLSIAVMGCEVNGPREASGADVGVAGAPGGMVLFRNGKHVETVSTNEFEKSFKRMLNID